MTGLIPDTPYGWAATGQIREFPGILRTVIFLQGENVCSKGVDPFRDRVDAILSLH
jgi:hypothetical protein